MTFSVCWGEAGCGILTKPPPKRPTAPPMTTWDRVVTAGVPTRAPPPPQEAGPPLTPPSCISPASPRDDTEDPDPLRPDFCATNNYSQSQRGTFTCTIPFLHPLPPFSPCLPPPLIWDPRDENFPVIWASTMHARKEPSLRPGTLKAELFLLLRAMDNTWPLAPIWSGSIGRPGVCMQAGAFALLLTCLSKLDDDNIGAKPPAIPKLGSEDIPAPALDLKLPCTSGTSAAPNHPPRLQCHPQCWTEEACKKQLFSGFLYGKKSNPFFDFLLVRIGTAVVSPACVLQVHGLLRGSAAWCSSGSCSVHKPCP